MVIVKVKNTIMETKIHKTLSQWFPAAFDDLKKTSEYSDYEILNHFASYTHKQIKNNSENKEEPFILKTG
jgi:hypothetical protein